MALVAKMPTVTANGVTLSYEQSGGGHPVVMIMGSGAAGRVWSMHQVPALVRAGYRTVTFDNRGIAPSACPPGRYTLEDLVADTRGLITGLGLGGCSIVGTSLGAMVAQELVRTDPELVRCAVLLATRARADAARAAQSRGEQALVEAGITAPPTFLASTMVLQMLGPGSLNRDEEVGMWLDVFEISGGGPSYGQAYVDTVSDRRALLREVTVPCRVIGFADDLVSPPHLAAEVAEAIPDCDYVQIANCGHLGYLEQPAEVNTAIIEFLDKHR